MSEEIEKPKRVPLITQARINADKISPVLKKNLAGKRLRKREIIIEWKLPFNQAYFVFEFLKKDGFKIEYKYITVPKVQPQNRLNPLLEPSA